MAEDNQPQDGDGGQAPTNAELDQRMTGLEGKLDLVLDKLGGAEKGAHDAAAQHTADRLDRPTTIADEIRSQLAEQKRADDSAAAAAADREWRRGITEQLAELTEKVPEAPVNWAGRMMGWDRP